MTDNILVSVIIPTYNRAVIVSRAIDSVLFQTHRKTEIVVVDDGSTDATKDVLTRYKDRIRYIYKQNEGVSSARNLGIQQSHGDYISFLDSDDIWYPEKLEKQLAYLENNKRMDGVLCDMEFVSKGAKIPRFSNLRKLKTENGKIFKLLIGNFHSMCTILVKRNVFNIVGVYDTELDTAEDIDMLLRIANTFNIGVIDETLVLIHKDTSSIRTRVFTGNRIKALEKIKIYAPEAYIELRKEIVTALAAIHLSYAKDLLWHRYCNKARGQIAKSITYRFSFKALALWVKSVILSLTTLLFSQCNDKGAFHA